MVVAPQTEIFFDFLIDSGMYANKNNDLLKLYYIYLSKKSIKHVYCMYLQQDCNLFCKEISNCICFAIIFSCTLHIVTPKTGQKTAKKTIKNKEKPVVFYLHFVFCLIRNFFIS